MKKEERRHTKLKAEEMIADCKIVISGKSQRQEQYHKIGMLDEGERIEYRYSDSIYTLLCMRSLLYSQITEPPEVYLC